MPRVLGERAEGFALIDIGIPAIENVGPLEVPVDILNRHRHFLLQPSLIMAGFSANAVPQASSTLHSRIASAVLSSLFFITTFSFAQS